MKNILVLLIALLISVCVDGQKTYYLNFDSKITTNQTAINKKEAVYVTELQQSQYIEGLTGKALDLSENAVLRKPFVPDSTLLPDYGKKHLSAVVWVKTIEGSKQGLPIVGNLKQGTAKEAGWSIYSQENGAWGVQFSDGKNRYTYKPNVPRQAINDGEWHQLAFSFDREKDEVWFYFDGENVAIYNVPGLGDLNNKNRTVIGGSDEYWEYGSFGQWTAFNGYIDEVQIKNAFVDSKMIKENYGRFKSIKNAPVLSSPLRVMVWNIWHGGRRYGKHVGVQRVIETIKQAQPDIVGLIETYGSGEIIADSLGYHFYLISSNLSIMSKFPITETIKVFHPFNSGGAIIDLGNNKQIALVDTWLHYLPDYGKNIVEGKMTAKELIKAEDETRHSEIKAMVKQLDSHIKNTNQIPLIMFGDFNVGSHLDWTNATKVIHHDYAIEWPVSKTMEKAGFKDSFREMNIDPLLDPGYTWTPRAATSSTKYGLRDRIDYIYYKGHMTPIESKVIDYHPIMFPSDHAGVLSVFRFDD
jgi:endonuclease/exonuclease/phosphatase family metal-dependent hydrolase